MTCEFDIPGSKRTNERKLRCCVCGYWMTQMEYGGIIDGRFINFIDKQAGNVTMTFCSECIRKLLEFSSSNL